MAAEGTVNIVISQRTYDWHAQIGGKPDIWGCGPTPEAAIGYLVRFHPGIFRVVVWTKAQREGCNG